jgi:predicted DNA-binding antitoxin AbrB/MazE fold protein
MSINFESDRMQSIEAANDASTLSEKVMQLKDLEDEIANAEESVKKLKEQARIISCIEIPQMMETMNIKKLKLKDGESVEVKKIYSASILEEKQQEAFEWLRNNGRGDIIKNDITVTFGRGEDNKAAQYAVLARGQGFEPIQKVGVNPQTLKATFRECVESGIDMPSDYFKKFEGNQTKITRR